jgi:hypothetical protein
MKLYTEEQIKSIYRVGIIDGKCGADINNIDYLMFDGLTSIELPSDEDIEEETKGFMFEKNKAVFCNGAKWMKEQILNQNK